jgi:DNA-binding LytR/AlgR family response regulator
MSIKSVIVEDEPFAMQLVKEYVEKTPDLELLQAFSNPIQALDFIQTNAVDLVFLDINMPDLNGMELSKIIKGKTKIIFTTAYEDYALESYKVQALDYLLKPFDYGEFMEAVQKAIDYFKLIRNQKGDSPFIYVRADHRQYKVMLNELLYIENLKNYVIFRMQDGSKIMALMSLKSLQESLPTNFCKIHRSFIINLDHLQSVETNHVKIDEQQIPISESHKKDFKSRMNRKSVN